MDTPTKVCTKCGQKFPATREYFHKVRNGLCARCKTCACEAKRAERLANPDRQKQTRKRYYESHKEEVNTYSRAWYQENKAQAKETGHRHYLEHKEYIQEKAREWRKLHPEQKLETDRKWRDKNREKVRASNRHRKAVKKSAEGSHTAEDIRTLLKMQKGRCWWCGKPFGQDYHVDHRIPLSRGGSDDASNLVITCPTCNIEKHTRLPSEWNGRLL